MYLNLKRKQKNEQRASLQFSVIEILEVPFHFKAQQTLDFRDRVCSLEKY